jgi:hypothetical protein
MEGLGAQLYLKKHEFNWGYHFYKTQLNKPKKKALAAQPLNYVKWCIYHPRFSLTMIYYHIIVCLNHTC